MDFRFAPEVSFAFLFGLAFDRAVPPPPAVREVYSAAGDCRCHCECEPAGCPAHSGSAGIALFWTLVGVVLATLGRPAARLLWVSGLRTLGRATARPLDLARAAQARLQRNGL